MLLSACLSRLNPVRKMPRPQPRLACGRSRQDYHQKMQQARQWLALHSAYDDAEDCGYPDW